MAEALKHGGQKVGLLNSDLSGTSLTSFQNTFEGLWGIDSKAQTIFANPCFCGMLGYTQAEIMALELSDLVSPEFLSEIRKSIKDPGKEISSSIECRLKPKKGGNLWARINVQNEINESGRVKTSLLH